MPKEQQQLRRNDDFVCTNETNRKKNKIQWIKKNHKMKYDNKQAENELTSAKRKTSFDVDN